MTGHVKMSQGIHAGMIFGSVMTVIYSSACIIPSPFKIPPVFKTPPANKTIKRPLSSRGPVFKTRVLLAGFYGIII